MANFMLIARNEGADFSKYSAKDLENLLKSFYVWTQKITEEGRYVSGEKLTKDLGKSLKGKNGDIIVDGPYADSKDAIAGYWIVKASSMSEALEIAKGNPCLTYGGSIEVREVDKI